MVQFAIPIAASALFSVASSLLAPTPTNKTEGNRIEERSPTAEFGSVLVQPFGVVKIENCPMTWALPLKEEVVTTRSGGGKGQPTSVSENYVYYMTARFDVALEIEFIKTVWLNGKICYQKDQNDSKTNLLRDKTNMFNGTLDQAPSDIIQNYTGRVTRSKGVSYIVFEDYPISEFEGSSFPKVDVLVQGLLGYNPKVKDVLKWICEDAGIPTNKIDISALDDTGLRGCYLKNDGQSRRDLLEDVMQIYNIYAQQIGDSIVFRRQGTESAPLVLSVSDCRTRNYGDQLPPALETTEKHYREMPSEIQIDFINADDDYKAGRQAIRDPSATHLNQLSVNTSIADSDGVMLTAADRILFLNQVQSKEYRNVFLLPNFNSIQVGQLIVIPDPKTNKGQVAQVFRKSVGENYVVEVEAKRYSAQYAPGGSGGGGYLPPVGYDNSITVNNPYTPQGVEVYGEAEILALDIPLIADTDSDRGIYIAVKGDDDWRGGTLFTSVNNGATWEPSITLPTRSVIGQVLTLIPPSNPDLIDRVTTIRVALFADQELDAIALDAFLSGENLALFGRELISFRNATLISNSPVTYDLDYLVRGYQGTYTSGHVIGEDFVLLDDRVFRLDGSLATNTILQLKAVPFGRVETDIALSDQITVIGESIRPIPPSPVWAKQSGGDWVINWFRRTRKYGGLADYQDIAYADGEGTAYRVLLHTPLGAIVRAVDVWATNFVYDQAMQVTDFGAVQSEIRVSVAQVPTVATPPKYSEILLF